MKTYGKYWRDGRDWCIECEPHVRIKLKRLFIRAKVGPRIVRVRSTLETCRDLEWFLSRYPLRAIKEDAEELAVAASRHRDDAERLTAIYDSDGTDYELTLPLRSYQRKAADVALHTGSLMLCDDVGLGKTAVAIACLAQACVRPAVVVTLTHLTRQWEREIARFAPSLRAHIIHSTTPYALGGGDAPNVVIMNYHKLFGWEERFHGVRGIVFDECQELRRHESRKYAAAFNIADRCDFRLGLSATPIYNYGSEMFNVLGVLRPGALGTRDEFSREWTDGGERVSDPRGLGSFLRDEGLMLRRTRSQVGRELPPLSVVHHHVDCDTKALEEISDDCLALCKLILDEDTQGRGVRMRAGGELDWRLRQQTGIAKAPYVARFVDMLVDSGEKVVLYGWHHAVYDVWGKILSKSCKPVLYTGEQSEKQKDKARGAFVEGEANVLIMSLRAGAGLDGLQKVSATVVFGELDWSPGVHTQCTGRVFRDGQGRPVVAYYLVADEGSDPVIADVLGIKNQQITGVCNPTAPLLEKIEADPERIRKLALAYTNRR